ncbi:MAG: ABC transporter permease [Dehalococcoidia bacterium]
MQEGSLAGSSALEFNEYEKRTRTQRIVRVLVRKRLFTFSLLMLLIIGGASAAAPWIAPYSYVATDTANTLSSPTRLHWFGSDVVGADTFSRVLYGGQVAFSVGGLSSLIATVLALIWGLTSVQIGGWFDSIFQRVVDAWLSMPFLVVVLTAVALFGPGLWTVIIILGVSRSFGMSRIVRGSALREKNMTYVEAAESIGASNARVAIRHVLPNVLPVVIVLTSLSFAQAILAEASLSFLGWGVPPPKPSWGSMLSGQVIQYMYQQPWLGVFPGIALTATVWAGNLAGDGLRDILDPRLRGQNV